VDGGKANNAVAKKPVAAIVANENFITSSWRET
jgi:hypothetical protein